MDNTKTNTDATSSDIDDIDLDEIEEEDYEIVPILNSKSIISKMKIYSAFTRLGELLSESRYFALLYKEAVEGKEIDNEDINRIIKMMDDLDKYVEEKKLTYVDFFCVFIDLLLLKHYRLAVESGIYKKISKDEKGEKRDRVNGKDVDRDRMYA